MDCLFCRIVAKQVPAEIVLEDDEAIAFADINPQAPVHVLIVPRVHVSSMNDAAVSGASIVPALLGMARRIAKKSGVADTGYRLVINTGPSAGQTVGHLHVHLLGGRALSWPPG